MPSPLRIRQRLRHLLGRSEAPESAPAPVPAAAPPAAAPPAAAPTPAPAPPPAPAPAPPSAPALSDEERTVQEKAARHLARTRHGLLGFVVDKGGDIDLGSLHDRSERRYFVGHKKFSDLMESMVQEGQLIYDPSTGTATITEAGRSLAAGPKP